MSLVGLETTLRKWGLSVVIHNIAGRPLAFTPIAVMGHHTAGPSTSRLTPSLNTIISGRPGIPGPLSQLYIGYDHKVHIITRGRANHAGDGGPWRSIPRDSGNRYAVGIETENVGNNCLDSEMLRLERLTAVATLDHLNRDASWYLLHKTWAPGRKPDIACINLASEQILLQRILNTGPGKDADQMAGIELKDLKFYMEEGIDPTRILTFNKVHVPGKPAEIVNIFDALNKIWSEVLVLKDETQPVNVDATAVANALVANPQFISAISKGVATEIQQRLQS